MILWEQAETSKLWEMRPLLLLDFLPREASKGPTNGAQQDFVGGTTECCAIGLPVGWGENPYLTCGKPIFMLPAFVCSRRHCFSEMLWPGRNVG